MKTLLIGLIAAASLAACAQTQNHSEHQHMHPNQSAQQHAHYTCENGMTAHVHYGKDQAHISLDVAQKSATLKQAVSGSGARYTSDNGFYGKGKASEWHTKGEEAMLTFTDPYNNEVSTTCMEKK